MGVVNFMQILCTVQQSYILIFICFEIVVFVYCRGYFFHFISIKIRVIDRKQEVPHDGPMCDLLWSDPEGNRHSQLCLVIICMFRQILKAGELVPEEQDFSLVLM